MADGRDEKVWTVHAKEHEDYSKPYAESDGINLRQWLVEVLPKGSKVVDFGCGSGLWRNIFVEYDYWGLDQNAAMIQVAKSRDNIMADKFIQTNWDNICLEDSSVDLIFTAAVLQHNKHPQKDKVVKEFHRILRPGGFYLATENTFREDNYKTTFRDGRAYSANLDDGYSFTPKGWEDWMRERGFELQKFENPSEYLYKRL